MEMVELMEQLNAAVGALEAAAARLGEREIAAEERVARISATVASEREEELEAKLEAAEQTIAELRAQGAGGRRTAVVSTVAKRVAAGEAMDAGSLDAALASLSIEQRFAVKAEMLRAGLLR